MIGSDNRNVKSTREVMRLALGHEPDENDVARVAALCHAADVPRGDPMYSVIVAIYALHADSTRRAYEIERRVSAVVERAENATMMGKRAAIAASYAVWLAVGAIAVASWIVWKR